MLDGGNKTGLQVLSWHPRIFVYRGFLTNEECDKIIALAKPRLLRSGVVDAVTGRVRSTHAMTPASFNCIVVHPKPNKTLSRPQQIPFEQARGHS